MLHRLPIGDPGDLLADPSRVTLHALLAKAADYFRAIRPPVQEWRSVGDLAPQLAEFELRVQVGDHDGAATVALDIDEVLLALGATSLVVQLHERLQGRLATGPLRTASLASLTRARGRAGAPAEPVELAVTFRGHEARITRLAWLPNGRTLLSASLDGTIRAWDLGTGSQTGVLRGHADAVLDLAATRDGATAVSASADGTLKVWDLHTGTPIRTFAGHTAAATAVALTADGRTAVSGSWDGTLKVWDLGTGDEQRTLSGHTDRLNAVALTADDRRVVSGAWDGTVRVWDLATGNEFRRLDGNSGGENDLAFVGPGDDLVASATEDGTVEVWELHTGRRSRVIEGPARFVTGVTAVSDGRLLAAKLADGTVRIWRTDTWELVHLIEEVSPRDSVFAGISFSPQGGMLATLGEEDAIIRGLAV